MVGKNNRMPRGKSKIAYLSKIMCPLCHNPLTLKEKKLLCSSCKKEYPLAEGIPNFCQKEEYWCNVSKEKMNELISETKKSGDWLKSAKQIIPEYFGHIEPFDRADAQFLLPVDNNSRILDAGSMWGGLTIPFAQFSKEIFAVDKTIETLEFLQLRADQMGFKNVYLVASPLRNLPFPDDYFDLVILNGVLEWVAFDQELILEKHWGKKRTDSYKYQKNPREMQIDVLKELRRVLKPGGHLYLGIENRFGYQYFAGTPDDHVNIRFVSFLPRFLASFITKLKINSEYRTYIYTIQGLRSILKESGYKDSDFYGAFPHYISPSFIIPIEIVRYWKKAIFDGFRIPWNIFSMMFPKNLLKFFSPSFIVISSKDGVQKIEPRLIKLLRKAGLINSVSSDYTIIKLKGRSGNYHAVNYLVYPENEPQKKYFCKICRNVFYKDILTNEIENLKLANKLLRDTDIYSNIPTLLFSGEIDNILFYITTYTEGNDTPFEIKPKIKSRDLEKLDKYMKLAIDWLIRFQKATKTKEVEAEPYLFNLIEKQKEKLKPEINSSIEKLIDDVKKLDKKLLIPICGIHGDYDFYHNILFDKDIVYIVDFEHFEQKGLPFLDLATLLLNPFIMCYEQSKENVSFSVFMEKYKIKKYINKWVNLYAEKSGISKQLLEIFIPIAALEQKTKDYPYYRESKTFPINQDKNFKELLMFRLSL